MIYGITIGLLSISAILVAYYFDFKSNPIEFSLSFKTVGKGILRLILYIVVFICLNTLYKLLIPLNKDYGIEFNAEREKIGIPLLAKNWKIDDYQSEQFKTTYWMEPSPKKGHFKKIIEYGILKAKTETDYFKNENKKGTYAWSIYNFQNETFEYYVEKPNIEIISVTEKGKLKWEKPTIITKIKKSEFKKYITE